MCMKKCKGVWNVKLVFFVVELKNQRHMLKETSTKLFVSMHLLEKYVSLNVEKCRGLLLIWSTDNFFFLICYLTSFIYLFIYLFTFGSVGSSFLCEGFLQLWRTGATLHRGARASHCRSLSLRSTGSRRAGSVVVAQGLSCSAACGIFPDQGSNPCPLHRQADSQPLRHQGSPDHFFSIKETWTENKRDMNVLVSHEPRVSVFLQAPIGLPNRESQCWKLVTLAI